MLGSSSFQVLLMGHLSTGLSFLMMARVLLFCDCLIRGSIAALVNLNFLIFWSLFHTRKESKHLINILNKVNTAIAIAQSVGTRNLIMLSSSWELGPSLASSSTGLSRPLQCMAVGF